MHVYIDDFLFDQALRFISNTEYTDYDADDNVQINETISYHEYVNVLDPDFVIDTENVVNKNLVSKFKELLTLYQKLAMVLIVHDKHSKTGIEYMMKKYDTISGVLYRMYIKDINTLYLNMHGIRKKDLHEY